MSWRVPNCDYRDRVVTFGGVTYRVTKPAWVRGYRPFTVYTPIGRTA